MAIDLSFVKSLSSSMQQHQFMLSYRGTISHEITKTLLLLTEKKLDIDGTETNTKKKVFNIMMECLQNISKHSDEDNNQKEDFFMIGKTEDRYFVYTGNIVLKARINALSEKISNINELEKDEIAELYKKLILENRMSDKGTAGLGLIDIARKSGNKLEYNFSDLNETHAYFTLCTSINSYKNN